MSKKNPKPASPPPELYYDRLLEAYVRGRLQELGEPADPALSPQEQVLLHGWEKEVNKFRKKAPLPRVLKVAEMLGGNAPGTVLEVGCGRGTAMWPLMEMWPGTLFTGADSYPGRAHVLRMLRDHGITQIVDGLTLQAETLVGHVLPGSYDTVLCLEVLEHLETERGAEVAVQALLYAARRRVIVSVPSVKDWNPDHKRLFTEGLLRNLFLRHGARNLRIEEVPKHFVLSCSPPERK